MEGWPKLKEMQLSCSELIRFHLCHSVGGAQILSPSDGDEDGFS
jgi:hypothetical protein